MNINADFRIALRAVVEKHNNRCNHTAREESNAAALAELLATNSATAKVIKRTHTRHIRAERIVEETRRKLEGYGLACWNETLCVRDADDFKKAGGKIRATLQRWSFDEVLAEFAAASEPERKKLCRKYGIRWK